MNTQTALLITILLPCITFIVGFLTGWFVRHNIRGGK